MQGILAWLTTTIRRLTVLPVLVALAERDLASGRLTAAKARFQRCARLVPFSFRAHFGLACVYLRERDFQRAQRELLLARQIAPARFLAMRPRLPAVPMSDGSARYAPPSLPAVALGEPLRPGLSGIEGLSGPDGLSGLTGIGGPDTMGDCVNAEEWERFHRMGPIRPDEAVAVDWERVLAEILNADDA